MNKYIITAHNLKTDVADWTVCDTREEAEYRAKRFIERGLTSVFIRECGPAEEVK